MPLVSAEVASPLPTGANLWSLMGLPYRRPEEVLLFIQDDDAVKSGNWGTSILAQRGRYGVLKTRVAEEWSERRGFHIRRVDRRLDAHQRRTEQEPAIALAGLDHMPPRRRLGLPGFDYIVDAGLGATAKDYRSIRVSTFGPNDDPAERFAGVEDPGREAPEELLKLPAYQQVQDMSEHGQCGAAEIAGQAVAVPFVRSVVGTLVVAKAVRVASGKEYHSTLTGDIADLRTIRTVIGAAPMRLTFPVDAP